MIRGEPRRRAALATLVLAGICSGCTAPPGSDGSPPAPEAERAQASAEPSLADWLAYSDPARGLSFRYPADLGTSYIRAVDWPPAAQLLDQPFSCTEAGVETARAGKTERAQIGARNYCVTRESEGAAGSIYTSYAYAFESRGRLVILTFTTRSVQCGNYDEPRRGECERERAAFEIDPIVDRIARTLEIVPAVPG